MVMKSIFAACCFVVMTLAIGTKQQKIHPQKVIHLMEEMNATCMNLMNGTCQRVNVVVFNINCERTVYRDTFCQINHALLNCKDYKAAHYLSGFREDKCTSKKSFISLKDFCLNMLKHIELFYRECANVEKNGK